LRSDKAIDDLARMWNAVLRGWIAYFGRFYKSALYPTFRHFNEQDPPGWPGGSFSPPPRTLRGVVIRPPRVPRQTGQKPTSGRSWTAQRKSFMAASFVVMSGSSMVRLEGLGPRFMPSIFRGAAISPWFGVQRGLRAGRPP
jgi:Group II intron, maturase-specific domain